MKSLIAALLLAGLHATSHAAPTLATIFADASVQGPSSRFRTVVLSGTDHFLFAQYREGGATTYAGVDPHGGWQYDRAANQFSELQPSTVAFLHAHDFHRTVLAPTTRYQGTDDGNTINLLDAAGGTITMALDTDGRATSLDYPDHRGGGRVQARPSEWVERDGFHLFQQLDITQGDDVYRYQFDRIAIELAPMLSVEGEPTLSEEAIELQRLHHLDQLAHLAGDAALFTAHFADPLMEISRGKVNTVPRTDAQARFQRYFDGVTFDQWRDVGPARLALYPQADHAEKIVEKEVVLASAPESPLRFAWLESWDRGTDGTWRLSRIVSTQ